MPNKSSYLEIQNPKSGKVEKIEWQSATDPTEADIEEISASLFGAPPAPNNNPLNVKNAPETPMTSLGTPVPQRNLVAEKKAADDAPPTNRYAAQVGESVTTAKVSPEAYFANVIANVKGTGGKVSRDDVSRIFSGLTKKSAPRDVVDKLMESVPVAQENLRRWQSDVLKTQGLPVNMPSTEAEWGSLKTARKLEVLDNIMLGAANGITSLTGKQENGQWVPGGIERTFRGLHGMSENRFSGFQHMLDPTLEFANGLAQTVFGTMPAVMALSSAQGASTPIAQMLGESIGGAQGADTATKMVELAGALAFGPKMALMVAASYGGSAATKELLKTSVGDGLTQTQKDGLAELAGHAGFGAAMGAGHALSEVTSMGKAAARRSLLKGISENYTADDLKAMEAKVQNNTASPTDKAMYALITRELTPAAFYRYGAMTDRQSFPKGTPQWLKDFSLDNGKVHFITVEDVPKMIEERKAEIKLDIDGYKKMIPEQEGKALDGGAFANVKDLQNELNFLNTASTEKILRRYNLHSVERMPGVRLGESKDAVPSEEPVATESKVAPQSDEAMTDDAKIEVSLARAAQEKKDREIAQAWADKNQPDVDKAMAIRETEKAVPESPIQLGGLKALSGTQGEWGNLAGEANRNIRAEIMSQISGSVVSPEKAGIKEFTKSVDASFGIDRSKLSGEELKQARMNAVKVSAERVPFNPPALVKGKERGVPRAETRPPVVEKKPAPVETNVQKQPEIVQKKETIVSPENIVKSDLPETTVDKVETVQEKPVVAEKTTTENKSVGDKTASTDGGGKDAIRNTIMSARGTADDKLNFLNDYRSKYNWTKEALKKFDEIQIELVGKREVERNIAKTKSEGGDTRGEKEKGKGLLKSPSGESAAKPSEASSAEKQPWEMTLREFKKSQRDLMGDKYEVAFEPVAEEHHKKLVKQALAEGKDVPEKILAQYPDLTEVSPSKAKVEIARPREDNAPTEASTVKSENKKVSAEDEKAVEVEKRKKYVKDLLQSDLPAKAFPKGEKIALEDVPEGELKTKPIPKKYKEVGTSAGDIVETLSEVVAKGEERGTMQGVNFDGKDQVAVATNGYILVVIPTKVEKSAIINTRGEIMDPNEHGTYPGWKAVVPEDTRPINGYKSDINGLIQEVNGLNHANKFIENVDEVTKPVLALNIGAENPAFLNPKNVQEALAALAKTGTKEVYIETNGNSKKPIVFRDAYNPGKFALVMGIRPDVVKRWKMFDPTAKPLTPMENVRRSSRIPKNADAIIPDQSPLGREIAKQKGDVLDLGSHDLTFNDAGEITEFGKNTEAVSVKLGGIDKVRPMPPELMYLLYTEGLGGEVKVGRLHNAWGSFNLTSNIIRLNKDLGLDRHHLATTMAHEVGHAVMFLNQDLVKNVTDKGLVDTRYLLYRNIKVVQDVVMEMMKSEVGSDAALRKELYEVSKWWRPFDEANSPNNYVKYRKNYKEIYADMMSVIFNDPVELQTRAPKAWNLFWENIHKKPEFFESYKQMQSILEFGNVADVVFEQLHEAYKVGGDILEGANAMRGIVNRKLPIMTKLQALILTKNAVMDYDLKMKRFKTVLPDENSPTHLWERIPYMDAAEQAIGNDMDARVFLPLAKAGLAETDLADYQFAKRVAVGDRSELINPFLAEPTTAKEMLRLMKERLGPQKFAAIEQADKNMRAVVQPVMERAYKAGLIGDEMWQTISENKDTYAPFAVVDEKNNRIGGLPKHQTGTTKGVQNSPYVWTMKLLTLTKLSTMNEAMNALVTSYHASPETKNLVQIPKAVYMGKNDVSFEPAYPPEGMVKLDYYNKGKREVLYVDKYIGEVFKRNDAVTSQDIVRNLAALNEHGFKAFILKYNIGFGAVNPLRDVSRTVRTLMWMKSQGYDTPITTFLGNLRGARAEGKIFEEGGSTETTQKMLKNYSLTPAYADVNTDAELPEVNVERAYRKKFGLIKVDEAQDLVDKASALLQKQGPIGEALDKGIRTAFWYTFRQMREWNANNELMTKIAMQKTFDQAQAAGGNVPGEKQQAYMINHYVGTPPYRMRGNWTWWTNQALPLSNVRAQGFVNDVRIVFNSPAAFGTYLIGFAAKYGALMIPSLAMKYGFLGDDWKEKYGKISSYFENYYLSIPLGDIGKKAAILTLPMDEFDQYFHAILMAGLNASIQKGDPGIVSRLRDFSSGVMKATDQQLMVSASPWLRIPTNYYNWFAKDISPKNAMTNRDVLTKDEATHGGWKAFGKMAMNSAQDFGAPEVFTSTMQWLGGEEFTTEASKTDSKLEKFVKVTPALNRFVRFTEYGAIEDRNNDVIRMNKRRAGVNLDARNDVSIKASREKQRDTKEIEWVVDMLAENFIGEGRYSPEELKKHLDAFNIEQKGQGQPMKSWKAVEARAKALAKELSTGQKKKTGTVKKYEKSVTEGKVK